MDTPALDLSLLLRLSGHSQPRTHRGKDDIPDSDRIHCLITKVQENELILKKLTCVGCRYLKEGSESPAKSPVIICTCVFCVDYTQNSLLTQHRPDLLHLPTTNGMHCTGVAIKLVHRRLNFLLLKHCLVSVVFFRSPGGRLIVLMKSVIQPLTSWFASCIYQGVKM